MTDTMLLLEEFFAPAEMSALWAYAMNREADFVASEVIGSDTRRPDATPPSGDHACCSMWPRFIRWSPTGSWPCSPTS